jgi:hypothetical protein
MTASPADKESDEERYALIGRGNQEFVEGN